MHLASGEQAKRVVEDVLRRLGRNELVLAPEDSMSEGPLHDVDAGGTARIDWYARIDADLTADDARALDDTHLWERVRGTSAAVVLWHGPQINDCLSALRACWHLRDAPERVFEVAMQPTGKHWRSGERPAFYDAIALGNDDVLVKAWDLRAKVNDVAERARQWQSLRDAPGDSVRVLEGESIVQYPITHYDKFLLEPVDWVKSSNLVGAVIARNDVGFTFMKWRVRALIGTGAMESRGEVTSFGLPAEVRRSPVAS